MQLRDLHTLDEFQAVVDMQREIWGREYDDVVPLSLLAVSVKIGGILVGAFDGAGNLIGFVFSVPALTALRPLQWSHMLAVLPRHRRSGIGYRLKLAQRERALAQALDTVEWTFDPLLVPNARLNVSRLGATAERYLENVYGASTSPLHRGAPTDRLVASWRIASPHVRRRLEAGPLVARAAELREAPFALETRAGGRWRVPAVAARLELDTPRLLIEIPQDYPAMLAEAPDLALEWRTASRVAFQSCFERGFRVVDFFVDRERAAYLLQRRG